MFLILLNIFFQFFILKNTDLSNPRISLVISKIKSEELNIFTYNSLFNLMFWFSIRESRLFANVAFKCFQYFIDLLILAIELKMIIKKRNIANGMQSIKKPIRNNIINLLSKSLDNEIALNTNIVNDKAIIGILMLNNNNNNK